MKRLISNHIITLAIVAITFGFTSCIDSIEPSEVLTSDQVRKMPSSQEGLINGILSYMITFDSWGSGDPLNDWGYPCQMHYRDVLGSDFPVYSSNYSVLDDSGKRCQHPFQGLLHLSFLLRFHCYL